MKNKRTLILLGVLVLVIASIPFAKQTIRDISYTEVDTTPIEAAVSSVAESLEDKLISETVVPVFTKLKPQEKKKTPVIQLTKNNMLILRGPVTSDSMNTLTLKLMRLSAKLPRNAHIYLVLDTPGGSIGAGISFMEVVKSIPQKVHTVTIFSASMGFQFVQNLSNRYIIEEGTLMSHRAKISGAGGEIPGELIVRLNHLMKLLNRLDGTAARRAGMLRKDYQELIRDEYWVDGQDAVDEQMADRVVILRCDKRLIKETEKQTIRGFLGTATLIFSKCPLITAPMGVNYTFKRGTLLQRSAFRVYVESYYQDRSPFVEKYIKNEKWQLYVK